jgi:hypothetical protein
MYYPADTNSCAQTRAYEWERQVEAMQLAETATGMPQGRSVAALAMGRLLADVFTTLRRSMPRRQARTA